MMRAASGVAGEGGSEDVDVGSKAEEAPADKKRKRDDVDGDGVQSDDKGGDVIKGGAHV